MVVFLVCVSLKITLLIQWWIHGVAKVSTETLFGWNRQVWIVNPLNSAGSLETPVLLKYVVYVHV